MKTVIIACDFKNKETLTTFLKGFGNERPMLKIGMEMFYCEGPELIKWLKEQGYPLFLDLKLHDIPNTVEKAMVNLGRLGADMVNVHASGGLAMMKAARSGLDQSGSKTKLLAVTVLTSIDQSTLREELLIDKDLKDTVRSYSLLAEKAGLDGVVCSAHEVPLIKEATRKGFLTVTPGIRLESDSKDDQQRITTPKDAYRLGADYIVVGRSITRANNPLETYLKILEE
ncbi:MAG: orotidine-5'-phosphate decarboxylase [Candidatus Izemoplasmatales bacterium]|jgi:orotidine-5'-phosphate decarboxylase